MTPFALPPRRSTRLTWRRVSFALLLIVAAAQAQGGVRADGEDTRDKENKAEAPERPPDMPLAELPELPLDRLPAPRPLALEAIDRLLAQIVDKEPALRERAERSLLEAKTDWVSGIARRMDRLAERADKRALTALMEKSRERLRKGADGADEPRDTLDVLLARAEPDSPTWRDLTQLLALSRLLAAIGTTEAAHEIIRIYVRFGEFIRIDCQLQLEALGAHSVAALIETRRHQAPAIGEWATKQLRLLKKLDPHEAIRTDDPAVLADVLVALGKNGDPETTRLLISFAGTEKAQVRKAARQGIALLGETAAWQLRDAYLDATGRQPPRDWTWKRTARELFTEFDRLRLEDVYEIFGHAKKAGESGDLKKMSAGFDRVLTLIPAFEHSEEMVAGYRTYAESVAKEDPGAALLALRRAERIDQDAESKQKTQSQRLILEATLLKKQGLVDQALLQRAQALDPESSEKAAQLASPGDEIQSWGAASRFLVAGAVSLVALLGAGWILFSGFNRRSRAKRSLSLPPENPGAAPLSAAEDTSAPEVSAPSPQGAHESERAEAPPDADSKSGSE